jgi:hypothetical protein
VKARNGFSTLDADKSHHVLRPIAEALSATSAEAVSPPLAELRDGAGFALARAEEEANDRLDKVLSTGSEPVVRKVAIGLRNRELTTRAELDAALDEVRQRVEPELAKGRRVRLV